MMTVTNIRYEIPTFKGGLVALVRKGCSNPIYVEAVKFVDTSNDMVFIYNGSDNSIVPTYGTIRSKESEAINQIRMELVTHC